LPSKNFLKDSRTSLAVIISFLYLSLISFSCFEEGIESPLRKYFCPLGHFLPKIFAKIRRIV
ncbi:hypothetical protein, partial [Segatella sp.]|uniref:hypothetical protein n=1 Tax=Segatella sp. TaxID=2974253 RepID=UPI00307A0BA5